MMQSQNSTPQQAQALVSITMGDCTIHFSVDATLLLGPDAKKVVTNSAGENEFHLIPFSRVLSADASLVDLLTLLSRMLEINNPPTPCSQQDEIVSMLSSTCIIDASYHPPRNITSILQSHPDRSGPRSKTLQGMGWFPSGTLVVLSSCAAASNTEKEQREERLLEKFVQWQSRHVLGQEEFGYNLPALAGKQDGILTKTTPVQYIGLGNNHNNAKKDNKLLKPTDIFNAMQQRFQHEAHPIIHPNGLVHPKRTHKRTERQRQERLDAILNNLQQRSIKKTSAQVRHMLIKSRSVGDKKLRMEDRFHLEIVRFDDTVHGNNKQTEENRDYRFFSRQTTAGKVASAVASSLGSCDDRAAEFLVSVSAASRDSKHKYRRLPNTMSLHDAQGAGWLKEFDLVLIRIYLLPNETHSNDVMVGPTKSVLEEESDDESVADDVNDDTMDEDVVGNENRDAEMMEQSTSIGQAREVTPISLDESSKPSESYNLQQRLQSVFQSMDAAEVDSNQASNKNKSLKKKKPISKQLQNMLMKSKATGNARIKQEDRVYLRVLLFHDDNNKGVQSCRLSCSYKFFDKRNDVAHIISSSDTNKSFVDKDEDVEKELILQLSNGSSDPLKEEAFYRKLAPSLTLGDAMQKKLLENFDSVLVRMFDKQVGVSSCEEWLGHSGCGLGS
ncbi:hypothetical protein HJC23_013798 [Cyclotella cryptica]|uniref:Uncharacterized protein n=1 Tax=Cyclotella cryptica TaxID=29204 RepID=A0ABD3PG29_9STRA|eukprot:CCRYP_014962-RA/>CCRYP_014962-RA protein AED:0.38 eAED:0.36 QI:0/-1/0/1/-1/1/1/0/670